MTFSMSQMAADAKQAARIAGFVADIGASLFHRPEWLQAVERGTGQRAGGFIVEQLGVNPEQVTTEAKFIEDLGADSLDTVELVMAFEEEFGVEVPDEDAEKLQSVGDVVSYIDANA